MILTLTDVSKLKKVEDKFSVVVHFHDGCGGQYFTCDEPTEELKKFIIAYFEKQNVKVKFSENGNWFSVQANL